MTDLFRRTGAEFSPSGRYRYLLWRTWDESKGIVTFIMLNPSTADATDNDPTVERCERRARAMGFGGLRVVNLFAWRSTDPRGLMRAGDPVGPENDAHILAACRDAALVVCGWGTHGTLHGRDQKVLNLLERSAVQVTCLARNADGSPKHPLYVAYTVQPTPFGRGRASLEQLAAALNGLGYSVAPLEGQK